MRCTSSRCASNAASRCSSSRRRACASRTAARSTAAAAYRSSMSRCASDLSSDCVSCCPCRSTSNAPSCVKMPTVVGLPLTQARERPSAEISRFSTSRPSSTSTPKAVKGGERRWRAVEVNSKAPSMTVLEAPGRTTSLEARSPSRRASASTSIDLPAPVSPVRTFKPGVRERVTSAMTARSRTRSSVSTTCARGRRGRPTAASSACGRRSPPARAAPAAPAARRA